LLVGCQNIVEIYISLILIVIFLIKKLLPTLLLLLLLLLWGAGGSVVVKALCYKPEGRGFDTDEANF
jgi:hypothetical protein